MKRHYCKAERAVIEFEGQCNWCDEKETPADDKQFLREFFSARQHQRLARFFQALHDLATGWLK